MGVNAPDPHHGHRAPEPLHGALPRSSDLAIHLPPLLETAEVRAVQLDVLTRAESFRGATVSPQAQEITGPARDEHRRRHFGFWEFVLVQVADTDAPTRQRLLSAAIRHNNAETITLRMDLNDFLAALADGSFTELPTRTIISLTSHVVGTHGCFDDDEELHLPMLDMGIPASPESVGTCVDAITALGVEGLLLESGRSYHFIGNRPISRGELTRFLAKAQLLSPIVDARWASHQLLDGQCGLRISSNLETTVPPHQFAAFV